MRKSTLLAAALLPLGLQAQDTSSESALTIRTSDPMVVMGVLQTFDSAAEAPTLGDGAIAILSLDDGGNVNVRTGEGKATFLHVDCRPAQLMEIFAAQVAQYQQMGQMFAGMGGAQMGLDFEDAGNIVSGLFAFPTQIDRLTVHLPTNPEKTKALDVDLEITPVADTWFGGLCDALQPNPKGVVMLDGKNAAMTFNANVNMAEAWKSLRPVMAPFSRMGQETKEDKENAARYMDATMNALEGTLSIVFDPGSAGLISIGGLQKDNNLAALMTEEAYAKVQVAAAQIGDMAEATFNPKIDSHRGVDIGKLIAIYDNPDMNPFANEDGEVETFMAIAGDQMITTMFGATMPDVKALIDDILDQELKRKQLAPNAIGSLSLDIANLMGFVEEMSQGQVQGGGEDMPEKLSLDVLRTGKGLAIKVRAK